MHPMISKVNLGKSFIILPYNIVALEWEICAGATAFPISAVRQQM